MGAKRVEVTTYTEKPVRRAHCQDCTWYNGNADCDTHAQSHAARFAHRTVVSLIGFTAYQPAAAQSAAQS